MIAVEMDHISRSFGHIRAVADLCLSVPQGSIFGLVGPNGAGKTTIINILLGLIEPTSGSSKVLGYDCVSQSQKVREASGVLFERSGLYEGLSVWDNLLFIARAHHMQPLLITLRIHELLDKYGLIERQHDPAGKLSRGMRRRLSLARALVHQPSILFLDEPSSGLDPLAAKCLRNDLIDYCQHQNATVFLTSHNLTEVEEICDHVGIIRDGNLISSGRLTDLLSASTASTIEVIGFGFDESVITTLHGMANISVIFQSDEHLIIETDATADLALISGSIINCGGSIKEFQRGKSSLGKLYGDLMGGNHAG